MPDTTEAVDCPECDGGYCLLCAGRGTVSPPLAALARKTRGVRSDLERENRRLEAENAALRAELARQAPLLSAARRAAGEVAGLAQMYPDLAETTGGPRS